ncbi:MAG: sporulation integral membrane protein YlbJ [Firmicutes bacterium]|nr:sporulation integral membrane protein YlbJ [Bacillota bacterium]
MRILILKRINVLLGAGLVSLLTLSLVIYPEAGVNAAIGGMKIFWEIVFPSLLPFFVLSEIMLGMGVVHFLGVLLEPLMRPLFNVPGVGAFALSMGLAAGYPMDAVITGKFRRNKMCTRVEGERLLSFTNTADPLFIFGAVAVGMFGRPALGITLATAHYVASFTVGIIFKYYHYNDQPLPDGFRDSSGKEGIFNRAVRALFKARREDGRPFGRLMGDAVKESMTTLLMICGFIMLFSVLVKVTAIFGILNMITPVIGNILKVFKISPELATSVFNGILEIDLGAMAASSASVPLLDKAIITSWIIAWSGLSVHGQVASVIHDTDIRMVPYVIARLLHGLFAAFYTWLLLGPLAIAIAPVSRWATPAGAKFNPLDRIVLTGKQQLIILGILLAASLLIHFSNKYVLVRTKKK